MSQTSILTSSPVARSWRVVAAAVLSAVACVGVVRAQTPASPQEGRAVRERRAGEASKEAPPAKAEAGEKGAGVPGWSGNLNAGAGACAARAA
jgi:hypothetical protein